MRQRKRECSSAFLFVFGCLVALQAGCGKVESVAVTGTSDGNVEKIRNEFLVGGGAAMAQANPLDDPNREAQWASLSGIFRVDDRSKIGTYPAIAVTKDQGVCGSSSKPSEVVQIGSNGGIKNVLFYLRTKLPTHEPGSVWVHEQYAEPGQQVFDQKKCLFLSHVMPVRTNQVLLLKNSDATQHNVNLLQAKGNPANPNLGPGQSDEYIPTLEESRPFQVSCSIHPWMYAYLLVRDTPYFAVTGDDGSFTINNIPAGVELEYSIWTEPTNLYTGNAQVTLNGESSKNQVKRGSFKLKLEPQEDGANANDITFVLDGSLLGSK